MSGWHYLVDGAAFGPADDAQLAAQLQDGTLSLETPVWREGMPGWTAVRAVPDALALASDPSLQLTQGSV